MKRTIILLTIFIQAYTSVCQENSLDHLNGSFQAGFSIKTGADFSRSSRYIIGVDSIENSRIKPRTLAIWTWYPSDKGSSGPNMTVGSYLAIDLADLKEEGGMPSIDGYAGFIGQKYGLRGDKLNAVINRKTSAICNATPLKGKFPVIIVGQGYNWSSPFAQFQLCEMLASNGYIVISVPLTGFNSNFASVSFRDMDSEADDLLFLINEAASGIANADMTRVGITGFDLGGMAALLAQMKNPGISAIATLDAGIMMKHNLPLLLESPYFSYTNLTAPLLHITRSVENNLMMGLQEDLSLFEHRGEYEKFLVRLEDVKHEYFTSYPWAGLSGADKSLSTSYMSIAYSYILDFFNKYLREAAVDAGKSYHFSGSREVNGIAVTSGYYSGVGKSPSLSDLEYLLVEGENRAAWDMFRKAVKDAPGSDILKEGGLSALGYNFMLVTGRIDCAAEVLSMDTELNPSNSRSWDNLGRAYIMMLEYHNALDCYSKSLELEPDNQATQQMVERLKKALNY